MQTTPYRLIGPYQDGLKLNGRAPRSLTEKLQARADQEHARRTAEIKRLAGKLTLLEPMLPALHERGAPIHDRDISLWGACPGQVTLRIAPSIFSRCSGHDDKLLTALLDLGFREIERKNYCATDDVTLKHGRSLLVRITVSCKPAVTPALAEV